jgi:hypothetical protein
VVAVPGVGAATGSDAVVELEITEARIDVVAGATDDGDDGRVGAIAEPGAAIAHGTVLLAVDDRHIVAVVEVADETAAILDAMADDDVEALEAILVYVGFDPAADISIDDEIDDATIAAIARWQTEIGVPATGSVDRDDYVVIEGASDAPLTVTERYLEPADRLDRSDVVMALGTPTLDVSAEIAVEEVDEFEIGQMVTVEQLDETAFVARVVEIAEVATPAVGDAAPTMTVDFEVVDEPDRFVSGPVVIVTEASRVDDALVVPTRALLTLREGGFAVERVLGDGTTTLVGVEIGTFDDGVVEIAAVTAGDLGVGDELVVPA